MNMQWCCGSSVMFACMLTFHEPAPTVFKGGA